MQDLSPPSNFNIDDSYGFSKAHPHFFLIDSSDFNQIRFPSMTSRTWVIFETQTFRCRDNILHDVTSSSFSSSFAFRPHSFLFLSLVLRFFVSLLRFLYLFYFPPLLFLQRRFPFLLNLRTSISWTMITAWSWLPGNQSMCDNQSIQKIDSSWRNQ